MEIHEEKHMHLSHLELQSNCVFTWKWLMQYLRSVDSKSDSKTHTFEVTSLSTFKLFPWSEPGDDRLVIEHLMK